MTEELLECAVTDDAEVVYSPDMASFDKALEGIDKRLNDLHGKIDQLAKPDFSIPQVLAPHESWLKRHVHIATILSLLFGSGLVVTILKSPVDKWFDEKLKEPLSKLDAQGKSIASIEGRVNDVAALLRVVVENELRRIGSLPQKEFENNLEDVKAVLVAAKGQRPVAGREAVGAIRERLEGTAPGLPGYWPSVGALVSLRSNQLPTDLKPCDPPPAAYSDKYQILDKKQKQVAEGKLDYITVRNCVAVLQDEIGRLHFENAKIIYRGGPLDLRENVLFINCEFDITVPEDPNPSGRKLARSLLIAQSMQSVTVGQ